METSGAIWWWGGWYNVMQSATYVPTRVPAYIDSYGGQVPHLEIVAGNNQIARITTEFALPLTIRVTDANGSPLSNAPISLEVEAGGLGLRTQSGGEDLSGLRATTDVNGEVSVIGHAQYSWDTNCDVKVLAVTAGQYARVDFTETLNFIVPTVSITYPTNGANLMSPALWVTVDAHEADATIQTVLLGDNTGAYSQALTQPPFTIEWTNVPDGTYTISAYAGDNYDIWSQSSPVTFTFIRDSDGHGLSDAWQMRYFGHLGIDPSADYDGDGLSNIQEYQLGTNPTNYYNGVLPGLQIVSGNDQQGVPGSFLPEPVKVLVTTSTNSMPLTNAPLLLTVQGQALLAVTTNGAPSSTLNLRTGSDGQAVAWVYFPFGITSLGNTIVVQVFGETNSLEVDFSEAIPGRLGYWRFNTSDWAGEEGQAPLTFTNLASVPDWSMTAVQLDSSNPAYLVFRDVEPDGQANINLTLGTVRFWFKPDWNSTTTNNGSGPGITGRLIDLGSPDSGDGWWSVVVSSDGTTLSFVTQSGGAIITNLSATVSWTSNDWHQVVLTYNSVR
jgi:hypothetical protein